MRMLGEGNGRSLLDVGCADGEISSRLSSRGWDVLGVEPNPEDAVVAATRGIEVFRGTVEEALPAINREFDAVLLADVLEHCVDPWEQLRLVRQVCKPGAEVVISLPNVAHLSMRAQLLAGRFRYTEKGLLDRTHLRFFTRSSAVDLVEQAGLKIQEMTSTPAPVELVFPSLQRSSLGQAALALNAYLAGRRPTVFAYQFVLVCK